MDLIIKGYGVFVSGDMIAFAKGYEEADRVYNEMMEVVKDRMKLDGGIVEMSMYHIDGQKHKFVASDTIKRVK